MTGRAAVLQQMGGGGLLGTRRVYGAISWHRRVLLRSPWVGAAGATSTAAGHGGAVGGDGAALFTRADWGRDRGDSGVGVRGESPRTRAGVGRGCGCRAGGRAAGRGRSDASGAPGAANGAPARSPQPETARGPKRWQKKQTPLAKQPSPMQVVPGQKKPGAKVSFADQPSSTPVASALSAGAATSAGGGGGSGAPFSFNAYSGSA